MTTIQLDAEWRTDLRATCATGQSSESVLTRDLADWLLLALDDIDRSRAVLHGIADSSAASPAGRAAWQDARRVLWEASGP